VTGIEVGVVVRGMDRGHSHLWRLSLGLRLIEGVTLHTPLSAELSSGMACFDYKDLERSLAALANL